MPSKYHALIKSPAIRIIEAQSPGGMNHGPRGKYLRVNLTKQEDRAAEPEQELVNQLEEISTFSDEVLFFPPEYQGERSAQGNIWLWGRAWPHCYVRRVQYANRLRARIAEWATEGQEELAKRYVLLHLESEVAYMGRTVPKTHASFMIDLFRLAYPETASESDLLFNLD